MIHRIRHQSRDYYREKSFLLHTYTFLCEHSRKTASFYHEFFTAKKISFYIYLKFLPKPHLLLLLYICLHPKTEIVTTRFSLYLPLQLNSSILRFLLHHFSCASFATIKQSFLPRKFSFSHSLLLFKKDYFCKSSILYP